MKTRLLGAAVLFALAVLFLPMIFNGKSPTPESDQAVSLAIPPSPDGELQTRTMSLAPDAVVPNANGPATAGSVTTGATTVTAPAAGDQLATVNIGSSRPRDVETDPDAGNKPVPTTVTTGAQGATPQPVIPMQVRRPAVASVPRPQPVTPPVAPNHAMAPDARTVDDSGSYTLNLSAYASAAGAANLQRRVQALGYPVHGYPLAQAGRPRTLVIAGPFGTRTAAEAARLRIVHSIPGTPARLEQGVSHGGAVTSVTASPAATGSRVKPGGWAVQLAAMSNRADAMALRDKLRSNGFDGFVDSVQAGGKTLWRVRAGPQTQRADAQRVHDQVKARLGIDGNIVTVP